MGQTLLVLITGAIVLIGAVACLTSYRRLRSPLVVVVSVISGTLAVFGLWQINSAAVLQVALFGEAQDRVNDDDARQEVARSHRVPKANEKETVQVMKPLIPDPSEDTELAHDTKKSESPEHLAAQIELGIGMLTGDGEGIVVGDVRKGSRADELGIRSGDRILKVNGEDVTSEIDFVTKIAGVQPGESVDLDIRRDEEHLEQRVRGNRGESYHAAYRGDDSHGASASAPSGLVDDDRINKLESDMTHLLEEVQSLQYMVRDLNEQLTRSRERTARFNDRDTVSERATTGRAGSGRPGQENPETSREGSKDNTGPRRSQQP
jgi:hypothetical protein